MTSLHRLQVEPPIDSFWSGKGWPRDPSGYLFLGRAVEQIGFARFGTIWTGLEFRTVARAPLPTTIVESPSAIFRALQILERVRPDHELLKRRNEPVFSVPTDAILADGWEIARQQSIVDERNNAELCERAHEVRVEIAERCESGELETAYRKRLGGAMHRIPKDWWNTERYWYRFGSCQIIPEDPFELPRDDDRAAWIFITTDSLNRYLVSQPYSRSAASGPVHLSPYMRLMLSVSEALELSSENQPKKEVVVAALREAWTGAMPLSAKLAEAMATLLRQPESQLGRAKKGAKHGANR